VLPIAVVVPPVTLLHLVFIVPPVTVDGPPVAVDGLPVTNAVLPGALLPVVVVVPPIAMRRAAPCHRLPHCRAARCHFCAACI
jgi:hypothetical protein